MADAVQQEGDSPGGVEITADVQQLLDDGKIALGIEDSHSLPPSDPGWEGGQVFAAQVAFKASHYTNNPIHSNMADLSVFPFVDNPSPSVHSHIVTLSTLQSSNANYSGS